MTVVVRTAQALAGTFLVVTSGAWSWPVPAFMLVAGGLLLASATVAVLRWGAER